MYYEWWGPRSPCSPRVGRDLEIYKATIYCHFLWEKSDWNKSLQLSFRFWSILLLDNLSHTYSYQLPSIFFGLILWLIDIIVWSLKYEDLYWNKYIVDKFRCLCFLLGWTMSFLKLMKVRNQGFMKFQTILNSFEDSKHF